MRFVKLILFITPFVFFTSCDIVQITGNLKVICNGEMSESKLLPNNDLDSTQTKKQIRTIVYSFENKKMKSFNLNCHTWTEKQISCSAPKDPLTNFISIDRENGEIFFNYKETDKGFKMNLTFKGFCEKLKNNKI